MKRFDSHSFVGRCKAKEILHETCVLLDLLNIDSGIEPWHKKTGLWGIWPCQDIIT